MKMVQKSTASERVVHWVLVVSFFTLTFTGFAFAFKSLNWINHIFGNNHSASVCHKWSGVLFLAALLMTIGSYLGESLKFGKEDSEWLKHWGGYFDKSVKLPPQGKLNFGQKMFYLVIVLASGLVISISGFMLWAGTSVLGHFLHNLAFFAMVVFMPIHIYLATAANPGVFRVMTRGTVPLEYARKHWGKWVKELGL